MARSISQIQSAIISDMGTYPELATLLANTSKRSIWYLFIYVISAAIALLEQIIDTYIFDNEAKIATAAAGTPQWLQNQSFLFQYDSTVPQIVKLDTVNFAPTYDTVNPALRIITKCSVNTTTANYVTLKVAKSIGGVLGPLTSGEINSYQGYINTIGVAGVKYITSSSPANQMYWNVEITYDAQYAAVMKQNIVEATNAFLLNIPFDGVFRVNRLECYIIDNVPGVIDIVTNELWIREDMQTVQQGTQLVLDGDIIQSNLNPSSGYIIPETTSGFGLLDGNNILLKPY